MTARDGTQERTLDPPDEMLSDADLRECERAAREGWRDKDDRSQRWLNEQLLDTPGDVAAIVRAAMDQSARSLALQSRMVDLVHRFVAERAEEYWGDLMDQAAHAQEERA